MMEGFNTASGRYYCNKKMEGGAQGYLIKVSIPQAVGTIAILQINFKDNEGTWVLTVSIPQAVGTIAIRSR